MEITSYHRECKGRKSLNCHQILSFKSMFSSVQTSRTEYLSILKKVMNGALLSISKNSCTEIALKAIRKQLLKPESNKVLLSSPYCCPALQEILGA